MLDRFAEIMKRMVPNKFVNPEKIIGDCLYCGRPVRHKDGSAFFFEETAHFTCRRIMREAEHTPLLVQASYLEIARVMHRYTPEFFVELEDDLTPYLDNQQPTAETLCRLIAFILIEAESSEHVSEFARHALNRHLSEIRKPYLATAN